MADANVSEPDARDAGRTPLSSWYGLLVMLVVGIYATIDRQVFILIAEPIKRDLSLSDTQLGLLQGVGLALVSVVTTYPVAWFADRFDRRWVTAICVVLWSLAVVACGFAPTFAVLMLAASLVGVGEAGAVPTAFAMIPDLFSTKARILANSIFSIGGRLSQSLAVLATGFIVSAAPNIKTWLPQPLASMADWRISLLAAAVCMPLAVGLVLSLPRSASGLADSGGQRHAAEPEVADEKRILPFYKRHGLLHFGFYFGYAIGYFGFTSVSTWVPVVAARYFHQSPAAAGAWIAGLGLATALGGFVIVAALTRWLQPRLGAALPMVLVGATMFLGGIAAIPIMFARDAASLYLLWALQATCLMVGAMVLPTVIQNMSPRHLRARVYAVGSVTALAVGALSPVAVGMISDALTGSKFALLIAAVSCSTVALVISGLLIWRLVPAYVRLCNTVDA